MDFAIGFEATGRILIRIAGASVAILLFAMSILLILVVAGMLFDVVTTALAKRWERKGYTPTNKLGSIILENHKRLGR